MSSDAYARWAAAGYPVDPATHQPMVPPDTADPADSPLRWTPQAPGPPGTAWPPQAPTAAAPPSPAAAAAAPASGFPAPGTPEGDRWAAAGYPVDPATHQPVIPAAVTVPVLQPGDVVGYPCHDAYAPGGARNRVQAIAVTGTEDNGAGGAVIRGIALGYTEDAASFNPDQLVPLS